MATITASSITAYNAGSTVTLYGAQATSEIALTGLSDEKVLLLVQNTNDSVAVNTATITIAPGDFLHGVQGTLSVDVADANAVTVIGPLEGQRFKNSASKMSVGCAVTQSGTVSSVKFAVINVR